MKSLQSYIYKIKRLKSNYISMKRYQRYSTAVRQPKKPECKFENEDEICLPRKRCTPQTTVCHTLPKQPCVITVQTPSKSAVKSPISPCSPCPPCSPLPLHSESPPPESLRERLLKLLPDENNMSPAAKMAYRFIKFNAKALIAGSSVYLTSKYGVWGNSDQTADLYMKTHDKISSLLQDNSVPVEAVPDSREIVSTVKHYWNKGVIVSVAGLIALPSTIRKWSELAYQYVAKRMSVESESNSE